ncbi:hypothetical protein Salat_2519500 [Sesamum alatum]|uniref:Uncharacterized protein n=1 Tax=Sesamum alatum TaxID=300844 RepID=A0AAE1XRW0_9LAMI|nr:hypothetical protein Salat_2519500 [Sesamum alatum]
MGYIYEAMDRAKEAIATSFSNNEEKYKDFFYTNPNIEKDEEVMQGLYGCISKLAPGIDLQDKIIDEFSNFIKYNRALKRRYDARDTIDPILLHEIDESNEWLLGRLTLDDSDEENVNAFEDDDLTWGDVAQATRVDVDAYNFRSRPSQESKGQIKGIFVINNQQSSCIIYTGHHHNIDEEEHFDDTDEEEIDYRSDDHEDDRKGSECNLVESDN